MQMMCKPWWGQVLKESYVFNSVKKCQREQGWHMAAKRYGAFVYLGMPGDRKKVAGFLTKFACRLGVGIACKDGQLREERYGWLRKYIEEKYAKRIFGAGRTSWMYAAAIEYVRQRDNDTCKMCGEAYRAVHHILPYKEHKALRSHPDNLVCLCHKCHQEAHAKLREEKKTIEGVATLIDVDDRVEITEWSWDIEKKRIEETK